VIRHCVDFSNIIIDNYLKFLKKLKYIFYNVQEGAGVFYMRQPFSN